MRRLLVVCGLAVGCSGSAAVLSVCFLCVSFVWLVGVLFVFGAGFVSGLGVLWGCPSAFLGCLGLLGFFGSCALVGLGFLVSGVMSVVARGLCVAKSRLPVRMFKSCGVVVGCGLDKRREVLQ